MPKPPHEGIDLLPIAAWAVNCSSHSRKAAFSVRRWERATSRDRSMRSSSALRVTFFMRIERTREIPESPSRWPGVHSLRKSDAWTLRPRESFRDGGRTGVVQDDK